MFKCMYKHGVCGEGHHFRDESQRGPYFDQGVTRVAFYNPNRKDYDGFCPAHAKAARTQYDHAMRAWNARNPHPTAAQQATQAAGKGKARSASRSGGAAGGVGAAGGGAGSWRGRLAPTDEFLAREKALLKMSYPRQSDLSESDADLSNPLEAREQRHEVMEAEEVNRVVHEIVTRRVNGMPFPQNNGSLSAGSGAWQAVDRSMLPLVKLGCPMNRADAMLGRVRGQAITDAMKQEVLKEFLVTGTVVVFAPEVRTGWTALFAARSSSFVLVLRWCSWAVEVILVQAKCGHKIRDL